MDKLARHSCIDRHVGDHRVANGCRCRDLDYVLTLPEVRQRTSYQASPAPLGSVSVVGHVTTYHRLSMWDYVTNM